MALHLLSCKWHYKTAAVVKLYHYHYAYPHGKAPTPPPKPLPIILDVLTLVNCDISMMI